MKHNEICPGNLVEIYRNHGSYDCDDVVRWCSYCGAVVIDVEVDGRISPGGIMEMMFPIIRKTLKQEIDATHAALIDLDREKQKVKELTCIIDNVAYALYPNADKITRDSEMMFDGMGAVDTINNLRAAKCKYEEYYKNVDQLIKTWAIDLVKKK
jgi:hypothetical protein